jgi:hypothetical protein
VGIALTGEWPDPPRRPRRMSRRQLLAALDDYRARAEADAETVAGLHLGLRQAGETIGDAGQVIRRLKAERDAAILAGQRAAIATLNTIAREREQHADDLAAAYSWVLQQVALPPAERAALPPAERTVPELLPSGQHAVIGGHPPLLLQLEDWEPLPVGTTGTNGTGGEQ